MNNSKQKMFLAIVVVTLVAALTVGATYSYWLWQSNEAQKTNVAFTIARPGFTITGTNVNTNSLAPTSNCAHGTYSMKGNATVVAENNTSSPMTASIVLSGKLTPQSGRTLNSTNKGYIKWAIKEVTSGNLTNYSSSNCTGTNSSSFSKGTYAAVGTTDTDIATSITFNVSANTTVTKYYQIYVWIDSTYPGVTTVGDNVTDPLEDLGIVLSFSESSTFTQNS